MPGKVLPAEFLQLLKGVKAKRPRTVIQHILEHGRITSEELQKEYGYNHPPRAIRDVRELGIPVETFRVTSTDGRSIAAYRFGDPAKTRPALIGRTAFAADLKAKLVELHGARCNIYLEEFPVEDLQVDHRVPFEICGDEPEPGVPEQYMLLCASANRAKSWSCEHCPNWEQKTVTVCQSCYWAYPDAYTHVAMREIRRLDILWAGPEVSQYASLERAASESGQRIPDYVKIALRRILPDDSED